MNFTPSREDYLIAVYLLKSKNGNVRSIDVAQMLGYSKPSVSNGIHLLIKSNFVTMDEQRNLDLTLRGEEKARNIYERYQIVLQFLQKVLTVPEQIAYQDTCRIEHMISQETLIKMQQYMNRT